MPRSAPAAEPKSLALLLDDARQDLDELCAQVGAGVRSADHFDQLEERAAEIRGKIHRAFRSGVK